MPLSESMRSADHPARTEAFDVRKEAERMVERHERQLRGLREISSSPTAFRNAALKSTESFKVQLKAFLVKNDAGELYDELVGFVSGKVNEAISSGSENSSQS